MNNFLRLGAVLVLAFGFFSCARNIRPERGLIDREFVRIANEIARDRGAVLSLRDARVGKSGYYYILDARGKVVFHPEAVLIGRDFGSHAFMREVLAKRSGCFYYTIGDREMLLIVHPLGMGELLCLSIDAGEVSGSLERCVEGKVAPVSEKEE